MAERSDSRSLEAGSSVPAMEQAMTAGFDWLTAAGCRLTPGGAGNGCVVVRGRVGPVVEINHG